MKVLVIEEADWNNLIERQAEIIRLLKELKNRDTGTGKIVPFITAIEFMTAVRIGRTKFDQLVSQRRIRTIKKDRKIYVPIEEVERYFCDK